MTFSILETAKEWGRTPEEFRALPEEEQAEMIALCNASNKMRAYDDYVISKNIKNR